MEDFSYAEVGTLTVEGSFFEVNITGYSGEGAEGQIQIPERLQRRGVEVTHQKSETPLEVRVVSPRVFSVLRPGRAARIDIKTPRECRVVVDNSSGAVSVAGIAADTLELKVSSGSLDVRDCEAVLSATSSSGRITVEGCTGSKTLAASSGSISVKGSEGPVVAETSSGSQTYSELNGSVVAESSSGRIKIESSEGTLDLRSSSGKLEGDNVLITGDSTFTSSSGSIDIDFVNAIEEISFELESSSGAILVGDTRARRKIFTGSGDIVVTGRSTSGKQSYR